MGSQDKKRAGTLRADFWKCRFEKELVEGKGLVRQGAHLTEIAWFYSSGNTSEGKRGMFS